VSLIALEPQDNYLRRLSLYFAGIFVTFTVRVPIKNTCAAKSQTNKVMQQTLQCRRGHGHVEQSVSSCEGVAAA